MSSNISFKQIPIVVESAGRANLGRIRSYSRVFFLAALILITLTGVFRIDLSSGYVIINKQNRFKNFIIEFGFWLASTNLLFLLFSSKNTKKCGWACPQNTASTGANQL